LLAFENVSIQGVLHTWALESEEKVARCLQLRNLIQ
jgi:hypothetical protein